MASLLWNAHLAKSHNLRTGDAKKGLPVRHSAAADFLGSAFVKWLCEFGRVSYSSFPSQLFCKESVMIFTPWLYSNLINGFRVLSGSQIKDIINLKYYFLSFNKPFTIIKSKLPRYRWIVVPIPEK